jgi:hypothetical protein
VQPTHLPALQTLSVPQGVPFWALLKLPHAGAPLVQVMVPV